MARGASFATHFQNCMPRWHGRLAAQSCARVMAFEQLALASIAPRLQCLKNYMERWYPLPVCSLRNLSAPQGQWPSSAAPLDAPTGVATASADALIHALRCPSSGMSNNDFGRSYQEPRKHPAGSQY